MIERDGSARLRELFSDFPVVLVSGARQVGKTTLVHRNASRLGIAQSVTLDHSGTRERAGEDPELFISGLRLPAFVDEVQKAPALFEAIKQEVDQRRRAGRFVLSGSANFLLLKKVSESLAGRSVRLFLRGLSVRELTGRVGKPPHLSDCLEASSARDLLDRCHAAFRRVWIPPSDWLGRILTGRFPDLALRPRTGRFRTSWLEAYVGAFVEKDLPDLGEVRNRSEFRRFWRVAASASAQVQDLSALAGALGVSYHTASRYLSLLEQGCHLFRLEPYYANIGKRLLKSPKIFLEDTGLAVFLSGLQQMDQLEASDRRGAWLENFVAAEMKGILETLLPDVQLWFWRTLAGAEVDLLFERGKRLLPVEIRWSSRPHRSELKGLESFLHDFHPRAPAGVVACGVAEPFLLSERIAAVPLSWLLT